MATGGDAPRNSTEVALKIAVKLIELGIVGEFTVNEFVALVNDIAAVIDGEE